MPRRSCVPAVKEFFAVDVLADEAIRQGIKEYASWPTIPQLYIKGEFVGAPTSCAKCMSPAN
jgi:glutaredoxin-related protein